ncbi:MAG TPA: hypothetical protein VM490_09050, partial [Armatimonadaceae bacterium]|nr:hypothetical protein [Armatimonadaceae bacterium]
MRDASPYRPTVGYLHLTLHLVSGGRYQFVQSDPDRAQGILDQVRPERLFAQKQLLIAADEVVTVVPTENVERIDLRSDPLPDWTPLAPNVLSVSEITEESYLRILRREPPPPPPPVMG